MKRFLLGLLLAFPIYLQAQNIKGLVFLSNEKTPAQFATVSLLQLPDSAIVTGVITLTDGGFLFEKVKPGAYLVKVSYVGYNNVQKNTSLKSGQAEAQLDTFFLTEKSSSLEEVTVTGQRLKGKELVDRTVYAVPAVIAKSSNTGYDLLKKIPQVNVDFQNNITLNGSSNFIIQVDGKQRDREYLAKLLPSDIETIEIISNPSGKYEGTIDGVINIILKKEARYGVSGNASLALKPFNRITTTGSGSLDYSAGKVTFYATGFNFQQNLNISSWDESKFISIDSTTSLAGKGTIKITNSSVNTGFDYYMNDKNNLSFNISYKPIGQDIDILSKTTLLKGNVPLNTINSLTNEQLNSEEYNVSLFYKKTFDKAIQEFTVESNYYWFTSDEQDYFNNSKFPYNSDSAIYTNDRYENNLNQRQYFSTKLNFVQPLGLNAKIETGYQFYLQQMRYDFKIDDVESNNLFVYTELRNCIYGGVTWNLNKLGFQAVLRVENSHISADSVTQPNYTCLLPSVNLQYKLSTSHNIKFTYNRRINRPGIYDMNPYFRVDQNYNISQGNPDLKPDYRDRLQMTYTMNFGSNYFSPYIYYEFFTGKIGRLYSVIYQPETNSLTTLTKPFNVLNGYETGGGLNAMLWYININARLYKGHYDAYNSNSVSIPAVDYFSYNITSYGYMQAGKKKNTTFYVFLTYNGVDMNAQSKTYNLPFYGFGGQQQFKNHSFGIFWLLPFSNEVKLSKTITETPYYNLTHTIGFNVANYIQFMYTYKFNRGRNVKKMNRQVEVESDSKSNAIGK
jgi:Outer membrane protein beta-barrel family/CarboxypepD_reg-like domain